MIYYDEKGKLRKETSWNSWRDNTIPNEEFENEPTDGFVLNRRAGGVEESWGWNPRKTYCRVYDPRGFEFEITIANLLWILENCNSIKGKGLEGEFVYGWDGTELVLVPVESPDYKELVKYNEILNNKEKIRKKDLIVGATYLDKANSQLVYIGCFDYYGTAYRWIENKEEKISPKYSDIPTESNIRGYMNKIDYNYVYDFNHGKYLWFGYKNTENKWKILSYKTVSTAKLITCIDANSHPEYADIFEELQTYSSYSPYDKSKDTKVKLTFEEFKNRTLSYNKTSVTYTYFKGTFNKKDCLYQIAPTNYKDLNSTWILLKENKGNNYYSGYQEDHEVFPYKSQIVKEGYGYWAKDIEKKKMIPVSLEEIFNKLQPFYVQQYLQNGKEYGKEYK